MKSDSFWRARAGGAIKSSLTRHAIKGAKLFAVTVAVTSLLQTAPLPALAADSSHAAQWQQFSSSLKGKYQGKKIRLIMINDPFLPAFNKMTDAFSELTGAKVSVDTFGYDATYQKEVLACGQKDKTYDIIVFDVPWTQKFVPCTDPLDAYVKKTSPALLQYDDFFPVMRQASAWNNEIVGFPFAPYFVLQSYNTKYYQTLGLKPAKTLDQFVSNAAAATKSEKLPNVYGTSMNNQSGSAVGQAFFEYIYNIPGGKPFMSEYPGSAKPYANMTPMFASKQGIAVVDMFKKLLPSQPPGALNSAWQQRQTAFATGHIAVVNEWDVTTPSLSDPQQSTVVSDFATADFPSNGKLVTQVGGWTMGINKNGTQKEFAWDFIKWFTSAETALAFSKAGGFPPRTSLLSNAELTKQYPWYASLRSSVPTAFADCRPRVSQSFDIINTLGTYIGKALAGSMSSKDAMLGADREIGTMLKKAGYRVDSMTD